jgi:tetratricopeptide (TPR) repeat protein
MRAFVFTDTTLTRHAGRFVWLSIDTEKPRNAAFRKRLKVSALPTLFVLAPDSGEVALRWVGSASVAQLVRLLDDGERAARGGTGASPAYQALLEADRHYGREDHAAAAAGFARALALAPPEWPAYGRAVESRLYALSSTDSSEAVVRQVVAAWPRLAGTASEATLAASALDAALQLPREHPERAAWVARFEDACRPLARDSLRFTGDDRSGIFFSLEAAREDAGDSLGQRALLGEHLAMLQRETARGTSPHQRTVYDGHRVTVAIALGQPERVVEELRANARDFPDDYNPPARLALAYRAMRRWDEAIAASDQALARVYGPRQFVVLDARIGIHQDMGDPSGVAHWTRAALARAQAMPTDQRSERTIARYQKAVDALPR